VAREKAKRKSVARQAEVMIEEIGGRGDGIARLDGRPLYVPFTLPGDRVSVGIEGTRGDGLAGHVLSVLIGGPGRVTAPCPHFGRCGGCALQHLEDGRYADWKSAQVALALARRGLRDVPLQPLIRIPAGTRRRATLVAERAGGAIRLGFHERMSHRVVDATACLILTPGLAALLPPLRRALRALLGERERAQLTLTEADTGIDLLVGTARPPGLAAHEALAALAESADLARLAWRGPAGPPEPVALRRPVEMRFGGVAVELPAGAFLQPSAGGEAALVEAVTAALAGCQSVADLYAGCGTFSFPLAQTARVHAVEGEGEAIGVLAAAARRAGLDQRVSAEARDLAQDPLTAEELARFDGVVFDPPRAGARSQAERLAASQVGHVVAVSCDPATFARDARILVDGGYRLESVSPVDQFIWSPHLELVAVFRR
jgi:23S rRNA (uracil1939-C5)-methyltransferase